MHCEMPGLPFDGTKGATWPPAARPEPWVQHIWSDQYEGENWVTSALPVEREAGGATWTRGRID